MTKYKVWVCLEIEAESDIEAFEIASDHYNLEDICWMSLTEKEGSETDA